MLKSEAARTDIRATEDEDIITENNGSYERGALLAGISMVLCWGVLAIAMALMGRI